jgi:hypothetical protein
MSSFVHFVGWSLRMCFSFNVGPWVARPVRPAAQAANFGLLDLQLTEADRVRSSCRCSSVNCLSSLPKNALARCGLLSGEEGITPI